MPSIFLLPLSLYVPMLLSPSLILSLEDDWVVGVFAVGQSMVHQELWVMEKLEDRQSEA